MSNTTKQTNPVIELVPIDDEELVTVTGGRAYGWAGGGWEVPDRPGGPTAGPIGPLPG